MLSEGDTMDRGLEARLAVAKHRKRALLETQSSLRERLREVQDQIAKCDDEIRTCEVAGRPRRGAPREEWRNVVRRMGTFTVSELATEMGLSKQTCKKHLDALALDVLPMVRATGEKVFGSPLFEYVKPTDAGEAYTAQREQRLRVMVDTDMVATAAPVRGQAVAGTGSNAWDQLASKPVREAVRAACMDGWRLERRGDDHFTLVKDGRRVGVPGTPRNPDGAADVIRRQTGMKRAS